MIQKFLFILFITLPLLLAAQEKKNVPGGSGSIDFSFEGFSSLALGAAVRDTIDLGLPGSVPIAGLGYRYLASENIVLRSSFGYSLRTFDTADTTGVTKIFTALVAGVGMEEHFLRSGNHSCYAGQLLSYSFGSARVENKSTKSTSIYSGSSYNVALLLGAEYFLLDQISLAAEYSLGISWRGQTREFRGPSSSATLEQGPSGTRFGTGVGRLIIHCYF